MLLGIEVLYDRGHGLDVRDASLAQVFDDGLTLGDVPLEHVGRDARSVADGFSEFGGNARFFDLVGGGVVLPNGVEPGLIALHTGNFGHFGDFTSGLPVHVKPCLDDDEIQTAEHDGWNAHWRVDHPRDRFLSRVGVERTEGPVVAGVHGR